MQDQYAGDVGDFGKFALLRHLSQGRRLGVCWYKTSRGIKKNNDGLYTSFLNNPDRFRSLDPVVFDTLKHIVESRSRSISALEASQLLPKCHFHSDEVPANSSREAWLESMKTRMRTCNFIFLDPDNGIERSKLTPKHVAISEIGGLYAKARVLIVYQHQGRLKATEEANLLRQKLRSGGWSSIEIIRLRPYSSRFYAIAGHDGTMSRKIKEFVHKWGEDRIQYF